MPEPLVIANAVGLKSGGGLTYLLGLLGELQRNGPRGLEWRVIVQPAQHALLAKQGLNPESVTIDERAFRTLAGRVLWEQTGLPRMLAREAESCVLLGVANYIPLRLTRPSVVVAHNILYFIPLSEVPGQRQRLLLETRLARRSVRRATRCVVPSAAMASAVRNTTATTPAVIRFGPGLIREARRGGGRFTFLHRTGWHPYKRLDVLLEAVRRLALSRPGAFRIETACNPFAAEAMRHPASRSGRALLSDPTISSHVTVRDFEPGASAVLSGDAVVMPSPTESFSFPLAEGVAFGMPIVAAESELAVEMCGKQAWLVPPDDPKALAAAMQGILDGENLSRAPQSVLDSLSWPVHVDALAEEIRAAARPHG